MPLAISEQALPLAGVPDGLVAVALREHRRLADGQNVEVRNRRGQQKTDRVELIAVEAGETVALDAAEEAWVLGASSRRWSGIQSRYGEAAWQEAVRLARAGVVRLRCRVDERMAVGEAQGWTLTEPWEDRRAQREQARARSRSDVDKRLAMAAASIADMSPELAAAVKTSAAGSPSSLVLLYAAEDLHAGVVHDGPRAFAQAHFEHTKARGDIGRTLTDAGVPSDVLEALGLARSSRFGLAGPVRASVDSRVLRLDLLDGPVLLRADQPSLMVSLTGPVPLVVVENLQAAEVLADQLADVAVFYTAGVPGRAGLRHLKDLSGQAVRTLLIPDADLGGVRIAEAVLRASPGAELIDIGATEHPQRTPWPSDGVSRRGLQVATAGPAASLARACLGRGYPVEQELATVSAVKRALANEHSDVPRPDETSATLRRR